DLAGHQSGLRTGDAAAGGAVDWAAARRRPDAETDLFSRLGLTYLGPIDGHDLAALAQAFHEAREAAEDPARAGVVVHVVTRKGAGFERAEADALDHWHATGPLALDASARPAVPV